MKILFVATVDIHIINHHLRIIHKLHELGHQVDVAANGDFINEDIHEKFNVPFSKKPTSLDNFKAQRIIKKIMKEGQYDIISCHTPLSSFFTRLVTKDLPSKVIYMAHGFHFYDGAPFINQTVYKKMEEIAAKYTDVLVTINEEDYENAKKFTLKKGGEVKLIPGVGIDEEKILSSKVDKQEMRKELGLDHNDLVLCSVGELNQNKNHLFVLNALEPEFKKNPHLHYVICGEGPLHETLQQWIHTHGLDDQIHLLGYREDNLKILYGCDIFLSPSFREGLPVSVLEAMEVGLPVIASNVRGNRDLIEDQVTGYLYPSNQTDEFLEKCHLCLENEALKEACIKQAKKKAHQYSSTVIDDLLLDLYQTK